MRLTDQMKAELDRIKKHTTGMGCIRSSLRKEIFERSLTFKSEEFIIENARQLRIYKVRLENLLCETDLKERVHLNSVVIRYHSLRMIRTV